MPYNVLIFPLIGGYYILTNFLYLKYRFQRKTSQEKLFFSIVLGVGLISITVLVRAVFQHCLPISYAKLTEYLNALPIINVTYLWTSIFTFVFAFLGTHVTNLIINKVLLPYTSIQDPIDIAVLAEGDELEELFLDSAALGELLQITLKNNKVYIGFTTFISPPSRTNYFILTPLLSGYRESETKKLVITTDYYEVYQRYYKESDTRESNNDDSENGEDTLEFPDIDIVIKQDEIITASYFDPDLYLKFNPGSISNLDGNNDEEKKE